MAFDIYGNTLRVGYCEVHPDVPESYPCSECLRSETQREYPEPTVEDYCGPEHEYYGDEDGKRGRCYCGQESYPVGGPSAPVEEREP